MNTMTVRDETWECRLANLWPPAAARLEETPEELRDAKELDEDKYQRLKTWERLCGQLEMKWEVCCACERLLVNGQPREEPNHFNPPPPTHRRMKR